MKKFLTKIIFIYLIIFPFFKMNKVHALIPYYYFPSVKNLQKESLSIGKNAYQLLYFGQYEDSLNLAKLAVRINNKNQKLWLILSEAQIANKQYKNALISLNNAIRINPKESEVYFAKSNVYLKLAELKKAQSSLKKGLEIQPNNHKAIFQLGNILLMEKKYSRAIKLFDKSVKIKPNFWPAINNQGLAYFEQDKMTESMNFFKKAIAIEENAEPLLGLATCLRFQDIKLALELVRKALKKEPKYVNYEYRQEQLWGNKLQTSVEILLQNDQLKKDILEAKSKIIESL